MSWYWLIFADFPVPTTCPDPPKLEHGKYSLGVPSTFYAYGKHNDTVGIINPTGGVWISITKFEIEQLCFLKNTSWQFHHSSLQGLISGTKAVYSCKKASFTLMCKEFGGDEEGEWKRCNGEKISIVLFLISFNFLVFFCIFLQVQGGGVQPWLLCELNLASTGWTRMQGMSRRRMWRKRSIRVFHLKVKHLSFHVKVKLLSFSYQSETSQVVSFSSICATVITWNFANSFSFSYVMMSSFELCQISGSKFWSLPNIYYQRQF